MARRPVRRIEPPAAPRPGQGRGWAPRSFVPSGDGDAPRSIPPSVLAPATPAWLPEGALAYADFVNGRYYAAGAIVSVSAMFGTNGIYDFNPGAVVNGQGFGTSEFEAAGLKGAALAAALDAAGCVMVVDGVLDAPSGSADYIGVAFNADDATWPVDIEAMIRINTTNGGTAAGQIFDANSYALCAMDTPLRAYHKMAFKLTATYMGGSIDGNAVGSFANPHAPDPIADVSLFVRGGTVKTLTVYPASVAVAPDADLPALSAL